MNKNMDSLFKELAEAMMIQKQVEKTVNDLKADIKEYMEKNNLEEIIGTEHKATYKKIPQTKFDRKQFEEDHPRMIKKYLVDNSYMRLNFT